MLLLDAGVDVNRRTDGDQSTPMLVAVINGQYDLAMTLLERGANPNLASDDGVAPLFAMLNNEWALRTWYPQPTAGTQQKASYLQLIEALLKAGADPNARTLSHIWYAAYNTGRMGVDFAGATPFWRAAYALDVDAMRLLVKYGADPNIPTMTFGAPKRPNDPSGLERGVPAGGPHVPPFHAASGVGYGTSRVAQQHRHVPDGWMPAAKYFLEELKRRRQHPRRRRLHRAASRRGARRQRDDHVSRQARRRRHGREPRGPDDRRHGQQPRTAHAAVPRDDQAARGHGREEQSQVPGVQVISR